MKLLLIISSALLLFSCGSNPATSETKNTPAAQEVTDSATRGNNGAPVYGIDISKYQGNIVEDINVVADTLSFVICKATEGINYTDPDFKRNWSLIEGKGLTKGAYHFYHTADDPIMQAKNYLRVLQGLSVFHIPPIVDIEQGSISGAANAREIQADLVTFLKFVEAQTNKVPMIYTGPAFANQYLMDAQFARYPLWLAEYSGNRNPEIPHTWKESGYMFWQKTDNYRIDAIQTDFDVFKGDKTDFGAFIKSGSK